MIFLLYLYLFFFTLYNNINFDLILCSNYVNEIYPLVKADFIRCIKLKAFVLIYQLNIGIHMFRLINQKNIVQSRNCYEIMQVNNIHILQTSNIRSTYRDLKSWYEIYV